MQSFQIQLASSFLVDSHIYHWIPFIIDKINDTNINDKNNKNDINDTNINNTDINNTNINDTNINDTNINDENNILKFIDTETIINYCGDACNIEKCVKIVKNTKYNTLVIFSNINIDILELKNYYINIIYWILNNKTPKIINCNNITIIEGYDINLYLELKKNINISKTSYKNEIINKFKKNIIY